MVEYLMPYEGVLVASAALAALVLIQMLVMDFAGIRARHVPGMPVVEGHRSFHFRATRAHGNTNESLPVQVLLVLLVILLGAEPRWSMYAAWAFTLARAGHMAFYYLDLRLARSIAFGVGLTAQVVLLVTVGLTVA